MIKILSDLPINKTALISNVFCQEDTRKRLYYFGVACGNYIKLIKIAPLGDPLLFQVANSLVAIRRSLAKQILVQL